MFYNAAKFIVRVILLFVFRLKTAGKENILPEGGAIIAVNHRSNWDPVIAGIVFPGQVHFMAKEELFKNPVFGRLIKALGAFPVHRGKNGDIGAIKSSLAILKQGKIMLIFPQGRRMKNGERGKAKSGVVMLAQRAKVPVIPLNISGEYKWMHKITATFGEPIYFDEYYGETLSSEKTKELAENVLDAIWRLGK